MNGNEHDLELAQKLREGSESLWDLATTDRAGIPSLGSHIADIPNGAGAAVAVSLVPGRHRRLPSLVLQAVRLGPGGARASITAPIFVGASMLPQFACAIAEVLETVTEAARVAQTSREFPARSGEERGL